MTDATDIHAQVAALRHAAVTNRAEGRPLAAEHAYRQALAALDGKVAPDHPTLVGVRQDYASLLVELGRDREAASLGAARTPPTPPRPAP